MRAQSVLEHPGSWALFLDIDGTLLSVAPTPDAVCVPEGLASLLDLLAHKLGGALAILTGRPISDADRLLAPLELVASGVHGTEMRSVREGPVAQLSREVPPDVVEAMAGLSRIAEGILVEPKGAGVAVHYRNAPLARLALESQLARIISESSYNLVVRQGRKVLEAVPSGFSKGTALMRLMQRAPFQGRKPVMIGDDVGDESAFAAAEKLGGLGLRVAGEQFPRTSADFGGVAEVRAWLESLAGALGAERINAL